MKHIVWTNEVQEYKDFREQMETLYPGYTEEQKIAAMEELNADVLEEERMNLRIHVGEPILVIADLGLWNGRHTAYKEIASGFLSDCLYSQGDFSTWYVNDKCEFVCDDIHHDGTNHYTYRAYRSEATEEERDELKEKIYLGTATQEDIDFVTRKLGPDVSDVYGWDYPIQPGTSVKTNIGEVPIEDLREILSMQAGFEGYEDMRRNGVRFGNRYDPDYDPAKKDEVSR